MQHAPIYIVSAYAKITKTLLILFFLAGGFSAVAQEEAEQATAIGDEEGQVTAEFEQLLGKTYGYLKGLDKYSAQGVLHTRLKKGDETQEFLYPFSLSKNGVSRFSISVYHEDGEALLTRLLLAGRQSGAQLYLPREMNVLTMMARIQDQPEGLVVPVVLLLYDFLEYSRPERWMNMLAAGHVLGAEEVWGTTASVLDMTFNSYYSFRDLNVHLPVYEADGDSPTIAGLRMDLSDAFRERPSLKDATEDAGMIVELTLEAWAVDTSPPLQDFTMPEPRPHFQNVSVDDIFALSSGQLPSPRVAGGQIPSPQQIMNMGALPQSPAAASALLSQFKSLPISEQKRLIREFRNSPAAGNLKSRARQMGLTEQDLQRLKRLVEP